MDKQKIELKVEELEERIAPVVLNPGLSGLTLTGDPDAGTGSIAGDPGASSNTLSLSQDLSSPGNPH
jgi:hypothetical protein